MARVTGLIGTTVSHYRVIGKLGVGGMGIVYDAEDARLPRRVALKFLPDELADDPDSTRRLEREAQTIALLNHPNICTIHEIDQHEGRAFIVMERLEGLNLKAYMAKKTLETGEIVDIALQIIEALHRRWVVLLRGMSDADFSRTFRHPEMGSFRLDSNLALYAWHGKHHEAHIGNLRKTKGW